MKYLISAIFLNTWGAVLAQNTTVDSLKLVNMELDEQITCLRNTYEIEGYDFVLLREYDTLVFDKNKCFFMVRKDSCTNMFRLVVNFDYSIHFITISNIEYANENSPCRDEITGVENHLSEYKNYLKNQPPDSIDFDHSPYTVYGKINAKYLYDAFDYNFKSRFDSGMFYSTICYYLHPSCD